MKKFTEEQVNSLKIATRCYYDWQRERIALDGRLGQKKDGTTKKKAPPRDPLMLGIIQNRRDELVELEKQEEKEIEKLVKDHPLWSTFLCNVKGCGPMMAAVILSEYDIHKASTVSQLCSFTGIAPGKDRKERGKKCPFNQFLRAKMCGVLASQFLMAKSVPYSGYYYQHKERLENSDNMIEERIKRKDRSKKKYKDQKTRVVKWRDAYDSHKHRAAIRKMIKRFLIDLYVAWRTIEGLPIREPYAEEYLGRTHKKK